MAELTRRPDRSAILRKISLPELIVQAGAKAEKRFIEFFTAQIRNPNTREAYARSVCHFFSWCDEQDFRLDQLEPVRVAAYVEQLAQERSAPTVKQHLSAIRMLFDYLVIGQILPFNPADAVRGPKHVVNSGKTPVLQESEARDLLESIDTSTVIGLRDRAILGVMTYSFARVGAVIKMRVKDYYVQGLRAYFLLLEKGGKYNKVPAHHKATEFLGEYIERIAIASDREGVLFRTAGGKGRPLTDKPMNKADVLRMIKRRSMAAGLPPEICCHTFRATGITNYLEHGGSLETAAQIAGHSSTRTTQLYDRTQDVITLDEIERIRI